MAADPDVWRSTALGALPNSAMNVVHVNLVIPMQTDQEIIGLDFK